MTANTSFIRGCTAAFALALAMALTAPASAEVAGKLLFVAGSVTLERTPPVALKAGDLIETGTVIATGEKSRAQILMNDGARVALRAASRYRVDDFSLPASVGAPTQATTTRAAGVSVATLLKGGFRSSTGAIGKGGTGTYEVRTPIGTLGIRGTDYTAVWCQGDCEDVPGLSAANAARNGMYLTTHAGSIVFRYGGREAIVEAGQSVFIAAADALPEPLERLPTWVIEDGAGPLTTGAQEGDVQGGTGL
ncbi:MAG TPA: FecR domain-containing protein, partial [Steroidobacteraceae bacterium]